MQIIVENTYRNIHHKWRVIKANQLPLYLVARVHRVYFSTLREPSPEEGQSFEDTLNHLPSPLMLVLFFSLLAACFPTPSRLI